MKDNYSNDLAQAFPVLLITISGRISDKEKEMVDDFIFLDRYCNDLITVFEVVHDIEPISTIHEDDTGEDNEFTVYRRNTKTEEIFKAYERAHKACQVYGDTSKENVFYRYMTAEVFERGYPGLDTDLLLYALPMREFEILKDEAKND